MHVSLRISCFALAFVAFSASSDPEPQGDPDTLVRMRIDNEMIDTYLAFEDYWFFVEDILRALNIESPFFIRNAAIGNAVIKLNDSLAIIIFDRRLSSQVGMFGAIAILAHEIGHYVCDKRGLASADSHENELQADRFAGAALRRMGYSGELNIPFEVLLSKKASVTHPASRNRNLAFKQGYSDPEKAALCSR